MVALPSVTLVAKDLFAECHAKYTRQRGHMTKIYTFWA